MVVQDKDEFGSASDRDDRQLVALLADAGDRRTRSERDWISMLLWIMIIVTILGGALILREIVRAPKPA